MHSPSGPERLSEAHDTSLFDCGVPSLNDWLKKYALTSQKSDGAQTFVAHRGKTVVGYYALAAGSVSPDESPERVRAGQPRRDIPVIVLARLAVDKKEQGAGLGKALLKSALLACERAAETIGARAVIVHAIDEQAASFYRRFDFQPSPVASWTMMLLMKDLRRIVRSTGRKRS